MIKKALVAALLVLALTTFFVFDFDRYLTLDAFKSSRDALESARAQSPWLFAAALFVAYVLVAALSVPGATILTLAAGALFGLLAGTLLVSFASTLGATGAFLCSRYLLRDSVQRRFGDRLRVINAGIASDGAFYLFTLRLVPLMPFFLVNLLMGTTRIPTLRFYWVSQAGMLAGTLVYVNAGTRLSGLERLADVASPRLLLSFALLGVLPWIARMWIRVLKHRRIYARWPRPKSFDRNLIVIGAGAAGLVSANIAAAVRAKVTLIEAGKMGGDCLHYGCVPSKALLRSAKLAAQIRSAEQYGLERTAAAFKFRAVMARVQEIIRAIEPHDSVQRYTELGVEVLLGRARLLDPWTVETSLHTGETRRLTARSVVIAAGSQPVVPPLPGLEEMGYVTSDTLWERFADLDAPPAQMLVLGGGSVGCELAQCFARLGSKVTQLERLPRLMAREDEDVAAFARATLERDGVVVLTDHEALRCERSGNKKVLVARGAGSERRIEFDVLLCAVGRTARLEGYGLEALGIPVRQTLRTNEYLETPYPNIFAAGDVAGPYRFTHTAAHQAWHATVNALFGRIKRFKVDYSAVPRCTFLDPEIARVGLNERDANQQGIPFEVTRFPLQELDRAIADSATLGFVKVLTAPGNDRILGVAIIGEHAGDLLAEYVLAMQHGLGLKKILSTIHVYPTLAEANKYAAGAWQRTHAPQRWLAWAQRYHAWRLG